MHEIAVCYNVFDIVSRGIVDDTVFCCCMTLSGSSRLTWTNDILVVIVSINEDKPKVA